jgi:CHAD domain-containing protein
VKAGRVKGLRPGSRLGGAAQRIAAQRVADMLQFDEAVRDPANIRELHDLRIAAKRLRYTLEVLGDALGPSSAIAEDEAKALQDVLGEVHDCDVLIPLVDEHVGRLRDIDRDHLLAYGGEPAALATSPNRTRYRGLEGLVAFLEARRQLRYEEFVDHWDRLLASQFRERVETALV